MLKRKLSAASYVRKSRLILALDLAATIPMGGGSLAASERDRLEREARQIISATADHVAAFKFNRHLVLPLGLYDRVPSLIDAVHDQGLIAIMDCKINDIGNTNAVITRYYLDAGFDAVIANPIVGWTEGLDRVFKTARERKKGVILLCYMSHPGAEDGFGLQVVEDAKKKRFEPLYLKFARMARLWDADGVIVGATQPAKIREVREVLGEEIPILSPGVGAQGGDARTAIDAGADYVIVGRAIVEAEDPRAAAQQLASQTW